MKQPTATSPATGTVCSPRLKPLVWQVKRALLPPLTAGTLLISVTLYSPLSHAGPQGGVITGGTGSISHSANQTTIQQTSQTMAIDWQSYNLAADERVQYLQPDAQSLSLNQILSNSASQIRGRIDANGQVILVNPNGVFFTPESVVNVGGLIAAGLQINTDDFLNGDYLFNELLDSDGVVINHGTLNAALGGNIALLGRQVENHGLIAANLGSVTLAAGKQAVLSFDGAGLLGVRVSEAILQEELGVDPAVLNSGEIHAEAGQILLTGSVSQNIFSQAVNVGSLQAASSVVMHDDGSFTLGAGADVANSGTLNVASNAPQSSTQRNGGRAVLLGENVSHSGQIHADAAHGHGGEIELHARDATRLTQQSLTTARSHASGQGGSVKLLGHQVGLLDQSQIDVSGAQGGGHALIGGDRQGRNPQLPNADFIYLGQDSQVLANGLEQGDGGNIISFANDTARIHGQLSARGGEQGGDGGFIETSGLRGFEISATPDAAAPAGDAGLWLIDPTDIEIVEAVSYPDDTLNTAIFSPSSDSTQLGVTLIQDALRGGSDVTLSAVRNADLAEAGDIIFNAALDFNGVNDRQLTLDAANGITFTSSSTIYDSVSQEASADQLNIALLASSDISIESSGAITTAGGDFSVGHYDETTPENSIIPTNFSYTAGTLDTSGSDQYAGHGGAITLHAAEKITLAGLDSRAGRQVAEAGHGQNGGAISLSAADISVAHINSAGGDAVGALIGNGGDGGAVTLVASSSIDLHGDVNALGGNAVNGGLAGASPTVQLNLTGSSGAEVTIHYTGEFSSSLALTGSEGSDTLRVGDRSNVWVVSGGTNTLNGTLSFEGIEMLIGGASNDSFIVGDDSYYQPMPDGGGNNGTLIGGDGSYYQPMPEGGGNNGTLIGGDGSYYQPMPGGGGNNDTLIGGDENYSLPVIEGVDEAIIGDIGTIESDNNGIIAIEWLGMAVLGPHQLIDSDDFTQDHDARFNRMLNQAPTLKQAPANPPEQQVHRGGIEHANSVTIHDDDSFTLNDKASPSDLPAAPQLNPDQPFGRIIFSSEPELNDDQ